MGRMPEQISDENFREIVALLNDSSIPWFVVRGTSSGKYIVAVDKLNKPKLARLLASDKSANGLYLSTPNDRLLGVVLARQIGRLRPYFEEDVWTLGAQYVDSASGLTLGLKYGCDIEFWDYSNESTDGLVNAPRENAASRVISKQELDMKTTEIAEVAASTISLFQRQMLDDVNFPIDAVYTWVDGEDPLWINEKGRREAELLGVEYHEEANHEARFRSRDELKYSLRSLAMYAPWFRKIYIVTAGQTPEWLDVTNPKIVLVNHTDIYPAGGYLPTFNSNSIISRLHHIPGLSEHYVYINDDVFFGREVGPDRFFLPSGIAKVSPSKNRRPFGETTSHDEPHLNLTRNMRALLEETFGVTISRAIKHTPHPQLKSVHFEMEDQFKPVYENTWRSAFRHHNDIVADQLHHYYAQIVGRAVPTNLQYNYINVLDDSYRGTMLNTLRLRNRDTFCINDAPVPGATPMADSEITDFLESYFPIKSQFEK